MSSSSTPLQPAPAPTALLALPLSNPDLAITPVTQISPPTFPPSETFDFIPQTHDLLLRLLPSTISDHQVPLEPRDVDAEASRIRIKIQKARTIISDLPDITRSTKEQEVEIAELEEKLIRQREILERVRSLKAVRNAISKSGSDGTDVIVKLEESGTMVMG